MCLGWIIRITGGEHLSLIRASYLTIFFVAGDVLGLAVQGAGAVVIPLGTLQDCHVCSDVVIGGLAILVVYFALFLFITVTFNYRIHRCPTARSRQTSLN
jgi:thiol:disulfide interchange protein